MGNNKRGAILLGVKNYNSKFFEKLDFIHDDLDMLEYALKSHDYNVETVLRHDKSIVSDKKNDALDFIDRSLNAEAIKDVDTLIFYYTGHGFNHEGKDYIVFKDGDIPPNRGFLNGCLELHDLAGHIMHHHKAKTIVFLIDACRNNVNFEDPKTNNWLSNSFGKKDGNRYLCAVTACGKGQFAEFGEGQLLSSKTIMSNFTRAIVDYFEAHDGESPTLIQFHNRVTKSLEDFFRKQNEDPRQTPTLILPSNEFDERDLNAGNLRNEFPRELASEIPPDIRTEAYNFLKELITQGKEEKIVIQNPNKLYVGIILILETLGLLSVDKIDNEDYILDRKWVKTYDKVDDYFIQSLADAIKHKVTAGIVWERSLTISRATVNYDRYVSGTELVHTYEGTVAVHRDDQDIHKSHVLKVIAILERKKGGIVKKEIHVTKDQVTDKLFLPKLKEKEYKYDISKKELKAILTALYKVPVEDILEDKLEFKDRSITTGVYTEYHVRLLLPIFENSPKINGRETIPIENLDKNSKFSEGFKSKIIKLIERNGNNSNGE